MDQIERVRDSNRYWKTVRNGFAQGAQVGFKEAIVAAVIQIETLKVSLQCGATTEELKVILQEVENFLEELRFTGMT